MVTFGAILSLKDNFTGTVGKGNKAIKGFGKVASFAGKAALGILVAGTMAVATAATVATKRYVEFDDQMRTVQAITRSSAADTKRLRDEAKRLGATTAFTAAEAGAGMEKMALAGFNTTQIIEAMPGVLDLAAASGEELALVSDIITDNLVAFGLSTKDTTHFADVMANTMARTNVDVAMLGEAYKYVSGTAGNLHLSLEEISAALGFMGDQAIKSGMAGRNLNSALIELTKGKKQDVLKGLGIDPKSIQDGKGNLKDLASVVEAFEKKGFGNMSEDSIAKNAQIIDMFGVQGGRAFAKLLTAEKEFNGEVLKGSAALREMTKENEKADGVAKKMAQIKIGGLGGAFTILKSAIDGVFIELGERLAPALQSFTEQLTNLTNKAQGIFTLGDAFGVMNSKLPDQEKADQMSAFLESFNKNTGLNLDMSQFEGLSAKFGEVKDSFDGLMATLQTHLTTIIQPLMAALGLEGASKLDMLNIALDGVKAAFDGLGQVIAFFTPIATTIIETLMNIAEPIITLVKPAFDQLMGTIQQSTPLWSFLGTILKGLGSIIGFVLGAALKFIIDQFNGVIGGLNLLVQAVVAFFAPGYDAVKVFDKIGEVIQKVIGYISDLIKGIGSIDFGKIKLPSLGGFFGGAKEASGISYVHRDEMPALLHKGEAVLTRQENKQYQEAVKSSNSFVPQNVAPTSMISNATTTNNSPNNNYNVTINIQGDNKNPRQIAQEVLREINQELNIVLPSMT